MLIVPLSNIPNPITIDSGIPSKIMDNTMGTMSWECCELSVELDFEPILAINLSLK
jgi:hypothetical protein